MKDACLAYDQLQVILEKLRALSVSDNEPLDSDPLQLIILLFMYCLG